MKRHRFAALLLLALGATWLAVAADPPAPTVLHVSSEPPGAAVEIDGSPRGITPMHVPGIAEGEHLVILTKLGFDEHRKSVRVNAGTRQALDVKLEPARGLVLLDTVPTGARITIDGADRGTTPLLLSDLNFGRHRVQAEAPDYLAKELDLNIENRNPVKRVIQLQSSLAAVDLRSSPPGATVVLDGGTRGITPLLLDRLPAGSHTLRISLSGHRTHEQEVTVASGQTDVLAVTLAPVPARVHVTSIPEGARIYLDNALRGRTPVTIDNLAPGPYRLRAELPGFATVGRTITLALATDATEEFRLDSNSGALELVTAPSGVSVIVDGQKMAVTAVGSNDTDRVSDPVTIRPLVQGKHTLQLVRKGYFSIEKTIEINRDETLTLHEKLNRRFIPDYEVVTATGVDQGVLEEIDVYGNVRLEVNPGVIKTIRAHDIKAGRPLQQKDLPEIAPVEPPVAPQQPGLSL
ncbi:MAG: PEGA domain-containing protein [Verrucomicrobia bacterium]|nr:PEGA domain-containing protein [Verrucomicrobiota bacterium]